MKRRAAVEPVIGHVKAEHRMDCNYLKGPRARPYQRFSSPPAGYTFSLPPSWFAALLRAFIAILASAVQ